MIQIFHPLNLCIGFTIAVLPIVKSDSTSQNSDLNQTSFLGKIRPKSDQNQIKSDPVGINVSYSGQVVKYANFAEKSDFC